MSLPIGNTILNSKERKKILQALEKQFGIRQLPEGAYIQNTKDRVYLINKDLERIPFDDLRIDSLGLYIGKWHIDGFRLSIEGAQVFEPYAEKNTVQLSDKERNSWLRGIDINWKEERQDFVIVKNGRDVLGCGKLKKIEDKTVLLNFTAKARRLSVINN